MNEQDILQKALDATHSVAGLEFVNAGQEREPGRDGIVRFSPASGDERVFYTEVRRVVDRLHTLHLLHAQMRNRPERTLLAATYISQSLAQECQRLGLNFIDMAGNAFIDVPGRFVFVSGRPRIEIRSPTPDYGALRTSNGLRLVFALLTQDGLVHQSQREMAAAAGVALGSVGKVLEGLTRLGHLSAGKGKSRRLLAGDELSRAWVQHFPVSLRHKLNPRRYSLPASRRWQDIRWAPGQAVWAGEAAANRMDGFLQPVAGTIYTWLAREVFVVEHRLRPDPQGDIEILDAFWNARNQADSVLAPALLVYADMMASQDGRSREAATRVWERILRA
ncbi:type IV toxin-antitoxin system AbiEi family antitoxin [Diaphorobacter aerolatus]|uniref:Uncharacterized protein n=1 Tax=Diaphorobacter aerolatus TaxID=1288495 RepID=A0A7H0GKM6_9BURK|nr:type IV toxin-antitoxin system AbiEi family antitoxin [Diaphorobacter aerolatus]QNP48842.1 hypothetical protein H9K75_01085 [Diaphorobacter aerolatus]